VRFIIVFEIGLWISLFKWIFRRKPRITPGGQVFGYARVVTPLIAAFIGVSAVELPIVHFLLPWPTVRFIVDLVSIYGLLWMFGLLAASRVNNHVVDGNGLRLRSGVLFDVTIPWSAIASMRLRDHQLSSGGSVIVESGTDGAVLNIGVMKHTDIEVILREPTRLPVPQLEDAPAALVRFAADEPRDLVNLARQHLGDPTVAGSPGR
jgi:hypothetical protein